MPGRLTLAQARRIALAAQGFGAARPARVTARHLQTVVDAVAQFQIDSVNVAVRAQYMPLFARLGPYDTTLLDAAAGQAPRRLFEYWGHAASLIDVRLQPALRQAMRRRAGQPQPTTAAVLAQHPDLAARVLKELAASGPLTARQIEHPQERRRDHWGWNWSQGKVVLEHLFNAGVVSPAGRNASFERLYALTEHVLPTEILAEPDPSPEQSTDALVRRAARALGVADLTALTEYFYLRKDAVRASVARLVASGELEPVRVGELPQPWWLWADARRPRAVPASALVSPFDSLVFSRSRVQDLFGVHYRIEIYTPAERRQYGYYVYLFVCADTIAARVDLKADRRAGVLQVVSAWLEEDSDAAVVAPALAAELHLMASWLGLASVRVEHCGTLGRRLARETT